MKTSIVHKRLHVHVHERVVHLKVPGWGFENMVVLA